MNKRNLRIFFLSLLLVGLGWASGKTWNYVFHDKKVTLSSAGLSDNRRAPEMIKTWLSNNEKREQQSYFSHKDLEKLIARIGGKTNTQLFQKELATLLEYPFDHNNEDYITAMVLLLSYWGEHDQVQIMDVIRNLPPGWDIVRCGIFKFCMKAWADKNITEALAYYSNPQNHLFIYQADLLPILASKQTHKSPDKAWDWLSRLTNKEQELALPEFFKGIVDTHPERMAEFMNKMNPASQWETYPQTKERENIVTIVSQWAEKDYSSAEKWVESLPDNWKSAAIPALTVQKAKEDLGEALKMISSQSKRLQKESAEKVAYELFRLENDYEKGLSWVKEVAKINKDINLDRYYSAYFNDPAQTKQRIDALPEGRFRDDVIESYLINDLEPDDKESFRLIEKIKDPTLRKRTLEIVEKRTGSNE